MTLWQTLLQTTTLTLTLNPNRTHGSVMHSCSWPQMTRSSQCAR